MVALGSAVRSAHRALLALGLASACTHAEPPAVSDDACGRFPADDEPRASAGRKKQTSELLPHHRYLAVTAVQPFGHHFTIWDRRIEPEMRMFRVTRASSGKLTIASEGGYWGALGVPGGLPPPIPREVLGMSRELEARFRAGCSGLEQVLVHYDGAYRIVHLLEFVLAKGGRDRTIGWFAEQTLAMDASLTRVLHTVEGSSGFGWFSAPADAQWLESSGSRDLALATAETLPDVLAPEVSRAARRFDAGEPPPDVRSLVPADEPLIPPGVHDQVSVHVSLSARLRSAPTSKSVELATSLDLGAAVFGTGAKATARASLDGVAYVLHVELTPDERRTPTPGYRQETYSGTLHVRLEDDAGHFFEHSYPASGSIELDGDAVLVPTSLEIPGNTAPSPEETARHGRLPGKNETNPVEAVVGLELLPARLGKGPF